MLCEHFLRIQNHDAAYALARAYNNWARDWCDKVPDRLFPAGLIPIQDTRFAMQELHRIAKLKFPVALVRPVEGAPGQYPNRIFPSVTATTMDFMDPLFRTFEETQVVLGMHTFPAPAGGIGSGPLAYSPGEFLTQAGNGTNRRVDSQTLSFVFEAMAWTAQVLLSGFLDRYPKLKMAIYESNSTWFPEIMERCDKLFKLYANERMQPAQRLPSEAFYQQGIIAFESDEVPVFRQWDKFENIGIWSSDAYHHDGADSWSAMREMEDVEVPHDVQAKLLGGNARRFYGVEGKMFVTEEPTSIPRPAWFPKEDEEFSKWWDREVYPRKHGRTTATHGHLAAVRGY
jgi:predicted TIM-barrel fold metal-dependent hydrolase